MISLPFQKKKSRAFAKDFTSFWQAGEPNYLDAPYTATLPVLTSPARL